MPQNQDVDPPVTPIGPAPAETVEYASLPGSWECCTCCHEDPDARKDYNPIVTNFTIPDTLNLSFSLACHSRAQPTVNVVQYKTLDGIEDYLTRRKVEEIRQVLSESVQRCHDALARSRGNTEEAMAWLAETGERPKPKPDTADVDSFGVAIMQNLLVKGGGIMLQSKGMGPDDKEMSPETEAEARISDD
ncbi:hypothetical protein B0A55_01611 [Friedmanniomyces simplex]|uniref:UBA domain-containing protein n=1 Tax=Friedmanniomyces simplex TaxID=329884 RepID=A0A4U0XT23_9PEZI|nr:hypothetical protein B0A55_01611 [Friedmanniomyces simplex]